PRDWTACREGLGHDDWIETAQIREGAEPDVRRELGPEGLHVPQLRLDRLRERGVQTELAGVLQVARHERVAEGRLHRPGRGRDEDDLRWEDVAPNHFVQTLDCTAKCHGRAGYASHGGRAHLIVLR